MTPFATPMRYSWQMAQWRRLWPADRLSHALLLGGPPGVGKRDFSSFMARGLLCACPGEEGPCGTCKSCHLAGSGDHPDLFLAIPPEPRKAIGVDRIREMIDFLVLKPHTAPSKVAVIVPAEALSANAANSLLKMLEEPPAGSYLILVADRPSRLPATVRSRCLLIGFPVPAPRQALEWLREQRVDGETERKTALNFAGGAPLRALALLVEGFPGQVQQFQADFTALERLQIDPSTIAARWKKIGTALSIEWLQRHIWELIQSRMAGAGGVPRITPQLQAEAEALDLTILFRFADALSEAIRLVGEPVDELLLLEDLLIRWVHWQKRIT